jgi:alkylation response protein AidB-like acyl-CoA dehydrogenase
MPTDTVPSDVTAVIAPHIPVLTSGAQAISTARAFAASIADGVIERDRSGALPVRELAALDASGLLAITVPRQHHGAEVPATVLAEVIRTIAAVDPAIAQVPQGHFLLVDVLAVLGTPGQQRRLFAEVLRGGRLGNGLAERGGLHAQDLKTRLHGRGSLTRLTGR